MDASDDIIESAKPPKPSKPSKRPDPGQGTSLFRQAVVAAAVATAVFTGITAWETHQERVNTEFFYCTFAVDPGPNPPPNSPAKKLSEQLDC